MNHSAMHVNCHPFSSSLCDLGHVTQSVLSVTVFVRQSVCPDIQFTGLLVRTTREPRCKRTQWGVRQLAHVK